VFINSGAGNKIKKSTAFLSPKAPKHISVHKTYHLLSYIRVRVWPAGDTTYAVPFMDMVSINYGNSITIVRTGFKKKTVFRF
jgi:hypothetical protein